MSYDPNLTTPEEIVSAYLDEVFDRRYPGRREREMEEYKQQGIQEGLEQGLELGLEKGIAQVIKAYAERNPEMSIQVIAESFELDIETARRLLQM